jgi:hypothetical protein
MSASVDIVLLRRSLSAVFSFYDAFYTPPGAAAPPDSTPPIRSPLDVSIPSLQWQALAGADATYRFSALTLSGTPPAGVNLPVRVEAPAGDYVSLLPIKVSLPLPVAAPPTRDDFLIPTPLWPTTACRPPAGETALRGSIVSPTAQPVGGLKVEMWLGGGPPPGSPFTLSDARGDFLFRFPLFKRPPGPPPQTMVQLNIRLDGGALAVSPSSLPIAIGATQFVQFLRT